MTMKTPLFAGILTLILLTDAAQARQSTESDPEPAPEIETEDETEEKSTTWSVSGGDIYQFDTDIDGGGSFAVNRLFLGGGLNYKFTPSLSMDIDIAAETDSYTFKGGGAFSAPANGNPWERTVDFTVRALGRWKVDDSWQVFLGGVVSWGGETDADFGDSFTGGGLFGTAYTFSDTLTLGVGVQISTRIEDDLLYIPSPIIDWRISEQFFISNVRGPVGYPASLGIEAVFYLSKSMNVSLGSRYEYRRFRLNDSGPIAIQNGVGTNSGFPVWLRYEWRPVPEIRIHLLGGVSFGQKLELDNRNGYQLSKENVDIAPFVGLFLGFQF
jgi:hypothetical protein